MGGQRARHGGFPESAGFYAPSRGKATRQASRSRPAAGARPRREPLLVAERRRAVGIIVLVLAEMPEAGLLVKRDCRRIVVADFEGDRLAAMRGGEALAGLEERKAGAPPGETGSDRDRIDARRAGALPEHDQGIAGEFAIDGRGEDRLLGLLEEMAERAAGHPVFGERQFLERRDGVEIGQT